MKYRIVFFVCVSAILGLFGCGEDVPTEPGEEVVTDKWIDPKDIGKEYRVNVEDIKLGDTVLLSDGETYEIGVLDSVEPANNGTAVLHRNIRRGNPIL